MRAVVTAFGIAILAAFLAAPFAPAEAQDWRGRGRVQGEVRDENGEPVEGAQVTLSTGRADAGESPGPDPLYTNKKGKWSFLGLTGGNWQVKIEKEGYLISEGQFPLNQFSANAPIIVNLKPIPQEVIDQAMGEQIMGALEEGNKLLAEGKTAEAREAYEAVLPDLEVENQPGVIMGIARAYYQEGNQVKTEETLKRALEVDPDYVDALKLLGSLLVADGREQEAKEYMDRLPEGEVLHADAYLNLGIDYYNDGKLDEALAEFNRVVDNFPDNADAYYYRGLVFLGKGENESSAADLKKYIELQPDGPRVKEAKEFLSYLE